MSTETLNWLNTRTLIGFTESRGNAWHYRAEKQGDQSNHYPGAIPLDDVERRLFDWEAVEGPVTTVIPSPLGDVTIADETRKATVRPPGALYAGDPGGILGVFKSGYTIHQYREWLTRQVGLILDDDLSIGSAGLLREGAVAWVQVEVPDSIMTPSGVEFRPNLLAATSLDGSLSTTYKLTSQIVVCDNTMEVGLLERSPQVKIRHSRYSGVQLAVVRDALQLVHSIGDDFSRQVEQLTNTTVTDAQWDAFLESLVPTRDEDGTKRKGRGLTMAQNKQSALDLLWSTDERVNPWRNTAFGVVQAVNTFEHHGTLPNLPGADRGERNMLRAVNGTTGKVDRNTLDLLNAVLA